MIIALLVYTVFLVGFMVSAILSDSNLLTIVLGLGVAISTSWLVFEYHTMIGKIKNTIKHYIKQKGGADNE